MTGVPTRHSAQGCTLLGSATLEAGGRRCTAIKGHALNGRGSFASMRHCVVGGGGQPSDKCCADICLGGGGGGLCVLGFN